MKLTKTTLIYAIAILLFGVGLYLWADQSKQTSDQVQNTGATVEDLSKAVADLQADHDGQDALAVCLGKLIIASQDRTVTDVEFETCVITTAVPARGTNEDTGHGGQTTVPAQLGDNEFSSSSPNNTPPAQVLLPENPQTPPPTEPQPEPDNEGIIVDLPILPKIHIPSPL